MSEAAEAATYLHLMRHWRDPETFHHWMRNDPGWAVQVRFVCGAGVPMSEYLGRVTAPGEPRWLPYDRMVAEEYERWSSQICPGCGLHPFDWPNELDETHAGVIDICHGCAEIADTRATIPDKVSERRREAMRVRLRRRTARELVLLEAVERGELEPDVLDDLHLP